jgi:hypothetical protein
LGSVVVIVSFCWGSRVTEGTTVYLAGVNDAMRR